MKKIIGIALVLAVVTTLCFGSVALAQDPTEVKISWGDGDFDAGDYPVDFGGGRIAATVTAGDDATIKFDTWGSAISGSFTCTDKNDNPFPSYAVDKVSSKIDAHVDNGYIEFSHERTASGTPYGPAGQTSYNYLQVSRGWGELKKSGSYSDYAKLMDYHPGVGPSQYQPGQFKVDANRYFIERTMSSNDVWATVRAWGGGTAELGAGYSGATGWGGDVAYLGRLSAYGNDCAFSGVHKPFPTLSSSIPSLSHFQVSGGGTSSVTFDDYWNGGLNDLGSQTDVTLTQGGYFSTQLQSGDSNTFFGPASWTITADFTGGLEVADYSITATD